MSRPKSFRFIRLATLFSGAALLIAGIAVRAGAWRRPILHDEWKSVLSDHTFRSAFDFFRPNRYAAAVANDLYSTGSIDTMRLAYAVFGILAILFAVALGRSLRDRLVGVFLAALFVVWPFKAYYDTMMREYTVIMTCLVAALWLWERYRARPTLPRFFPPLILTGMVSLTHETAPIVLCIPPLYVGWSFIPLLWQRFRRKLIDARAFNRRLLVQGAQLLLLLLPCIFLYQYSLSRDLPIAPRDTFTGPAREAKVIPTPAQALQFNVEVAANLLRGGLLDPRPLYQVGTREQSFQELMTGFRSEPFDSPGWLPYFWAPLLLIGSVLLAWRSPPLLAVCWALILINNMMLVMNFHLRNTTYARYWTFSLTGTAILIAAGLAALVLAVSWLAARRRLFRRVRLRFALGAAAVLLLLAFGFMPGYRGAGYYPKAWGDLTQDGAMFDAREAFGGGPLLFLHNLEPYTWRFFSGLAAMRHERAGLDPLESPARDRFFDINRGAMPRGIRLLDIANGYSGIVMRKTAAGNLMDDYASFPHDDYQWLHERYWFYPNRDTVYITRGRASVAPMRRFATEPDSQGNRVWSFSLRHEIPGRYRLDVILPPGVDLPALEFGGQPAHWEPVPAAADSTTMTLARLRYDTPGHLKADPVPMRITVPGDAYRPVELNWRLIDVDWKPVTASLEIGPLRVWRERTQLYVGLPMRFTQLPPTPKDYFMMHLILIQGTPPVSVWEQQFFPDTQLRGLDSGGMMFMGPVPLPMNILRRSATPSALAMNLFVQSPSGGYPELFTVPDEELISGSLLRLGIFTE